MKPVILSEHSRAEESVLPVIPVQAGIYFPLTPSAGLGILHPDTSAEWRASGPIYCW